MTPFRGLPPLALALVLAGGLLSACGGEVVPPGPTPGTLLVSLSGAGATDGAILIRVSGGSVSSVMSAVPYTASGAESTTGYRVVVTGDLHDGAVVHLQVPDVNAIAGYSAVVEQVADRNTFALLDPVSRRVTITR